MKKLLMISVLLLVGALSVSAQTYCYKCISKVSEDGVREKGGGWTQYYTFVNSKSVCYHSDKDGNKEQNGQTFKYVRNNNGIIEYNCKIEDPIAKLYGRPNQYIVNKSIYFSSDYSRINITELSQLDKKLYTWVFERVTAPENQNAPSQLY